MTTGIFHLHSGIRFLVLALAVGVILFAAWGVIAKRPSGSADRGLMAAFTRLLDLQFLVGVAVILTRPFYGAVMGHVFTMFLAVAAAHVAEALARKASDDRRAHLLRLMGALLSLLLIVAGLMAIGRTPLQMTV